jgi:GntR family transcriptional regulator, arabinose operon transcriptional repressor
MGSIPTYMQVANEIKAEWLSGLDAREGAKLPTQEELAERFGVSRSTVMRALSKLIAEGYLHSQQGSGVYVAETLPREINMKCISMIVPDLHASVVIASCRGVERRARRLGYQVLLASSEYSVEREKQLFETHARAGTRGIVLYPTTRRQEDLADDHLKCWSQSVPVVTMDIGYKDWLCSRVQFDNYRLGYDMTQQLIQHGHRRIAFMHTAPEHLHSSIHDRRQGWEAALDDAGLELPDGYRGWPVAIRDCFPHPVPDEDYEAIAMGLLALDPRPDALIAWQDPAAAHLTQALINQGVRIPEEIRVTGFDCEPMITRLFQPQFPTSKPDFVRLGELAVDALVDLFAGTSPHPRIYYYPVPVLWRDPRSDATTIPTVASQDSEVAVVEA